jgi:hypothetical protein
MHSPRVHPGVRGEKSTALIHNPATCILVRTALNAAATIGSLSKWSVPPSLASASFLPPPLPLPPPQSHLSVLGSLGSAPRPQPPSPDASSIHSPNSASLCTRCSSCPQPGIPPSGRQLRSASTRPAPCGHSPTKSRTRWVRRSGGAVDLYGSPQANTSIALSPIPLSSPYTAIHIPGFLTLVVVGRSSGFSSSVVGELEGKR